VYLLAGHRRRLQVIMAQLIYSLINVGFKATKEIKITDSFSIPMFGSIFKSHASKILFMLSEYLYSIKLYKEISTLLRISKNEKN
jgi:hypothetical protein